MPTRTESALVAVFGDPSRAQAAARELLRNAFAADHIHMISKAEAADDQGVHSAGYRAPDLKRWLASVFGQASSGDRQHYKEAIHDGKAAIGVSTPHQMVSKAVEILNHHAPLETVLARDSARP